MLVLTRLPGETILIGSSIEIHVIRCEGQKVKIGITAPGALKILRSELTADIRPGDVVALSSSWTTSDADSTPVGEVQAVRKIKGRAWAVVAWEREENALEGASVTSGVPCDQLVLAEPRISYREEGRE